MTYKMKTGTKNIVTITMAGFNSSYMDEVVNRMLDVGKEYPDIEIAVCNSFIRLEQEGKQ